MAEITREQVAQVAKLARLGLTDVELDALAPQLSAILSYVEQLQSIDTRSVEPLYQPSTAVNVLRPDVPLPSLGATAALQNAPDRADTCFRVPAVLDSGS